MNSNLVNRHRWFAGLVCCALLGACGESYKATSTSAAAVRTAERTWVDASRRTPSTSGGFAGADSRSLRTRLWFPDASDALPLLVMAHGFGGAPEKFDAFARAVAAAGYIVAAPAFPLTNEQAPGGHDAGFRDYVHQPQDLSFVITQLLSANATAHDVLFGRIRDDQIAVLGHSMGGITAIALTRMDCCRDTRVAASVLFAAVTALSSGFGGDTLNQGPPTLIVQGTADPTVAYDTGLELYETIDPPRYFVGLQGAGHSEALESQSEPPIAARAAAQTATIAFLDAQFRGDSDGWRRVRAELAAAGHTVRGSDGF